MHSTHHHKPRKKSLSDRIGEEFINEIMMAGIAFLIVMMGVNYFNMKWAWIEALGQVGASTGVTTTMAGSEITSMLSALTQTFPFKYFFVQYNFWGALILAVVLTGIGVGLKLFTTYTKGKFVIDIGKNIYVPAIVGLLVIVFLQFWAAINVDDYITTSGIARPELVSGFFVWNTYGQLFLLGASLLVVGSIIKLVGEKNRSGMAKLVGETLFKGSLALLAYYFLIRILTLDVFLDTGFGRILELFVISNKFSNFAIALCIFMFFLGRELRKYGVAMLRREKHAKHVEQLRGKYAEFQNKYGARLVQQGSARPQQHHRPEVPKEQRPHHPQHMHRYAQQSPHYTAPQPRKHSALDRKKRSGKVKIGGGL